MNTNKNQVVLKIFGEPSAVKAEVQKLKSLHSIYILSEQMQNDDGLTDRVYMTVPIEIKNDFASPRQESSEVNPRQTPRTEGCLL